MTSKDDGFLVKLFKSIWYIVVLAIALLSASVILMGIEGNNEELVGWKVLSEQEIFNKTLINWISSNARAADLRARIGLTDDLDQEQYSRILQEQLTKNYTSQRKVSSLQCSFAQDVLTDWNTKYGVDSLMFAISTVSTVGWGVYYPPNTTLKIITIIYAAIGLPLFATLIGFVVMFIQWIEHTLKEKAWVKKYVGGKSFINFLLCLLFLTFILIYSRIILYAATNSKAKKKALVAAGKGDMEWTYLTSLYYVLITITTIGFGDEYFYRTSGDMYIGSVLSFTITTFLISVFARMFTVIEEAIEERVERKSKERQPFAKLSDEAADNKEEEAGFRETNIDEKSVKHSSELLANLAVNVNSESVVCS